MRDEVHPKIPMYYLRYEDLVLNPEPVLREMFCFLLSVESVAGTVIEKRIADYVAKGSTSANTYKLKADPRKNLSRNKHMYTEAQLEYFKERCKDYLYYYNYCSHPEEGRADPSTTFFEYTEGQGVQHDTDKLESLFDGYKRNNEEALARVLQPTTNSFHFNKHHPCNPNFKQVGLPTGTMNIKQ
mmetsp:Transcript_27078/g.36193  ORF Transcript_27078/g.36193 Transcript_27078/m.36193 type:complete len:185 (+) Transcript_27078:157-711(+)